jgi:hypothetical protein
MMHCCFIKRVVDFHPKKERRDKWTLGESYILIFVSIHVSHGFKDTIHIHLVNTSSLVWLYMGSKFQPAGAKVGELIFSPFMISLFF